MHVNTCADIHMHVQTDMLVPICTREHTPACVNIFRFAHVTHAGTGLNFNNTVVMNYLMHTTCSHGCVDACIQWVNIIYLCSFR